jgi:hypothetical protein
MKNAVILLRGESANMMLRRYPAPQAEDRPVKKAYAHFSDAGGHLAERIDKPPTIRKAMPQPLKDMRLRTTSKALIRSSSGATAVKNA